jgi:ubiquinone/menaquinone biosynthesis C-methylase UbiE
MMLALDVGSGTDSLDTARGNVCIDLCRHPENRPSNFVCADAQHLPFKEGVFDKVSFFEVIEHVDSPIQCLREMHRTLKENGMLEVTTPNIFHWRILIRQMRGRPQILSDTGHISSWTMTEMQNLLQNARFTKICFSYLTLPLVFSPHKTLDKIAKWFLPASISQKNMVVMAMKTEAKAR